MNVLNLLTGFEIEINKIDDQVKKPVTDDSLYWINQGIVKFVKTRFNGANPPHYTSYEQNEKRTRDLLNLYKSVDLPIIDMDDSQPSYDDYHYDQPDDLMFVLNEDVVICDNDEDYKKSVSVFECTADSFMYRVMNSLTDFHYRHHYARPLRIRKNNEIHLLTDKNYKIYKYTIGYLKVPQIITSDVDCEYNDFPEYIWPEIIKIAAQMYIENQQDPRYQTITAEITGQE